MASFAHGATLLSSSPTASTSGNLISGIWSSRKTVECKKITGRQQSRCRSWRMKKVVASSSSLPPEALFFDCDGVLVDTERDGHRISFNQAFEEKGLDVSWDVDLYGELLKIGGGKERMTHFFNKVGWPPVVLQQDAKERAAFVAGLHRRKTELFMELIETGALPLRPGVSRLVDEALSNGVKVAVCSTSNEKAVSAIVRVMLGSERASSIQIFAGDVVPRKKPDPAIYQLAASSLSVEPARCVVVEDSGIGLTAAKAAGMVCIVTKSGYTEHEDFSLADAVFACIGDPPTQNFDLTFCRHLLLQEGKTAQGKP
jgi:HAD superfamily hydrolase (TIGR01509 family)